MSKTSSGTFFGKYLQQLRWSRGYSNVQEYLRKYTLAISDVHYRDLESGKRNPSIDSAQQLCEALHADSGTFYYYLLKDVVPEEVMRLFVQFAHNASTADDPELVASNEHMREMYQKAVMRTLGSEVLYPDEKACEFLKEHFELMPIIWFIYSTPCATADAVEAIAEQNEISTPVRRILADLEKYGLISVGKEKGQEVLVRRVKPTITFLDQDLLSQIVMHETKKSLEQLRQQFDRTSGNSVTFNGVAVLPKEARQRIMDRIADVLAEIRGSAEDVPSDETTPYFYSLNFASRPQYHAESAD